MSRLPTRLNPFQKRKKQEIRTAVVRISCRWRRKRIRLIAERVSLLTKAKRQPRGRGFGGIAACNLRLHENPSSVATKNPTKFVGFLWRRKRDSNPRGLSPKRFSRPPRYDRFDIPPLCMPGKNNTNRGQDAVFLTNTALRSRLRRKVLTRSRALSLPENTASDSQATKSSIFPMIFGKNERSCT